VLAPKFKGTKIQMIILVVNIQNQTKQRLLCIRHSFIQKMLNCSNPLGPLNSQNHTKIGNEFVVQLNDKEKFVTVAAAINPSKGNDNSNIGESFARQTLLIFFL